LSVDLKLLLYGHGAVLPYGHDIQGKTSICLPCSHLEPMKERAKYIQTACATRADAGNQGRCPIRSLTLQSHCGRAVATSRWHPSRGRLREPSDSGFGRRRRRCRLSALVQPFFFFAGESDALQIFATVFGVNARETTRIKLADALNLNQVGKAVETPPELRR
jgi:hypothetical protein